MGIYLKAGGRSIKCNKTETYSSNIYMRLLVKLYKYLARRTGAKFNKVVLKRLIMARSFRRPISLGKLLLHTRRYDRENSIVVIIGTITNDIRELELPKLNVAALSVTENARRRIIAAGGKVYTIDQLAQISPEGKGTVLLKGNMKTEKKKMFGTPGAIGSHSKPKVRSKGKNFEKGRGRRASSGYKK
ncbi:ribosomal protein L18, partial [Acrasis kona]